MNEDVSLYVRVDTQYLKLCTFLHIHLPVVIVFCNSTRSQKFRIMTNTGAVLLDMNYVFYGSSEIPLMISLKLTNCYFTFCIGQ